MNTKYEKYIPIYKDFNKGVVVRPKMSGADFEFELKKEDGKAYKLKVSGETTQNYMKKCEPACIRQYHSISDSLDVSHAVHDAFCLDFSSERPERYVKRCFKKIMWKPKLYYLPMEPVPNKFEMGICVTGENVKIEDGGYLRMRADVRLQHDGVEPRDIRTPADLTYVIDVPQGSFDFTELSKKIEIPENTASVSVFVEGKLYSGTLYAEMPELFADGQNLLPDFAPDTVGIPNFNWTGQHFSRKEWPKFRVELNGENVYEGKVFERCHRASEWEILLPTDKLKEKNVISMFLTSDYNGALPYAVNELALLEIDDAPFSVISVSETAPLGGNAYALIRTKKDGMRLSLVCGEGLSGDRELYFEKAGLHGFSVRTEKTMFNAAFVLSDGENSVKCTVDAVLCREDDGVITGTGDMVYIRQDEFSMNEYLSWYFANHIGNMITIRPDYRWSGTVYLNEEVIADAVRLFNELGVYYVHMADGRENPGRASCPPDSLLAGEYYLGRQSHELDGQLFYWGNSEISPENEADMDMEIEICREEPKYTKNDYRETGTYENGKVFTNHSDNFSHDVVVMHDYVVDRLKKIANGAVRHTGPATVFKYFLEAGYGWTGAETMYSSTDVTLSFLRGAGKLVDTGKTGVHHALQWSTMPHEREDHYRRYRLALYSSYMLGATDINTEEGLYHIEEYYSRYNRHSECCLKHLEQQRDFYRYVQRHTRKGSFYSNMAFIYGRYDGMNGFSVERPWGWTDMPSTEAERSWELMSIFYPQAIVCRPLYYRGCPDDKSLGYNSSSPLGNVDVLPIEAYDSFSDYRVLAFLGYNLAKETDLEALCRFVSDGGTLILTRAHLTCETNYDKIKDNIHSFKDSCLSFTNAEPEFLSDTYNGEAIEICTNAEDAETIYRTDSGKPLLIKYSVGKGKVLLFNTPLYPSNVTIRNLYEKVIAEEKDSANRAEPFSITTDEKIGSAVYKQPDGSFHVYFNAIDWYNAEELMRTAKLCFDGNEYEIKLPFGRMVKCVLKDGTVVWAESEDGEILSVGKKITVQGTGKIKFNVAKNGAVKQIYVDFGENPVKEIG